MPRSPVPEHGADLKTLQPVGYLLHGRVIRVTHECGVRVLLVLPFLAQSVDYGVGRRELVVRHHVGILVEVHLSGDAPPIEVGEHPELPELPGCIGSLLEHLMS